MFPINLYPYQNVQDYNLDWTIKNSKNLTELVKNFISLNSIKYANPIQWNITTQYEANTVVVDPNNGNAYISVQPVPAGVALTNTDYWTIIFTLDLTTANNNITSRNDGTNANATFTSAVGDWLLWDSVLYKVIAPISIGDVYVPNSNIEVFPVENFIKMVYDNMHILDAFPGATSCEKLFNALDAITSGVIIAGDIVIDDVYIPSNKDYRDIIIHGASITVNVDRWFDASTSLNKSVPKFNDCTIKGNGYRFYTSSMEIVGPEFDGCTIDNLTLFDSNVTGCYIQSLRVHGTSILNTGNFFTCDRVYDMKIIDSRIESAAGTLITINEAIMQASIHNTLIEGRPDRVIEVGSAYAFTVDQCYFEANQKGLINQNDPSGACFITVTNCWFIKPQTTSYAINITSSDWTAVHIANNVSNFGSGKYLTNVWYSPREVLRPNNVNYDNNWPLDSEGHKKPTRYSKLNWYYSNRNFSWNSGTSTWDLKVFLPADEPFYLSCRPFDVYIQGSFGSSDVYSGYAIIRVCPRTYYDTGISDILNTCDVTVIDGCNNNNITKTNTVTCTATLSDTSPQGSGYITLKISGFNNLRDARAKIVDTFGIVDYVTEE